MKTTTELIMNQNETQCKKIIAYICENGHITSLEAYKHLGITQLGARIADLESRGFVFNRPRQGRELQESSRALFNL